MATTAVEICNLALDVVSVTNKVQNIASPTTKEEYACARWYATVRDIVLRRFPWPFARKVLTLTSIDDTETDLEWAFLYDVPTDWLKSRKVFIEGKERNPRIPIPFKTFLNSGGTKYVLGADTDGLSLVYTRQFNTDQMVPFMPASFVDAVAAKLAAKLVKPLSLDAGLVMEAEGLYVDAVQHAFAENTEEQQFDPQPDAEWVSERE